MTSFDTIVLPVSYTLHARILTLLAAISERLGEVKAAHLHHPPSSLERAYRVSTIHATLALEDNPLDRPTIAAILDGHVPDGGSAATLEVLNTKRLYDIIPELDPFMTQDLRHAHGELMHGLAMDAGHYRTGPMEIRYGDMPVIRTAAATNIPSQMEQLLHFAENDDAPQLITSCVLHYALAHLRPFSAGNGRIARLWQKRVLMRQWPVFGFLPVESFLQHTRPGYYAALEFADRQGDCGGFILYLMERIDEALYELVQGERPVLSAAERVGIFLRQHPHNRFARIDYRRAFPELSTATASRDLAEAVNNGTLELHGSGRTAWYRHH